jgi:hypothetical protein
VLERIVENWLIRAGEKGYQVPFAQLLSIEGHHVLHGPVHHPFEHGKDIVTFDGQGRLCAFQLKGGDQDQGDIEAIQSQLLALAAGAVTYPGIEPPRRPDRVFLVVSGALTPPARDRIGNFNHANRNLGYPSIEVVEKEQLVARFVAAHGEFLPTEPTDLNDLLKFYLGDGRGPFPVQHLLRFVVGVVTSRRENPSNTDHARAIGSSLLLTAYAASPWQRAKNHLGVAEAWLTLSCGILRVASEQGLREGTWRESYELAFTAARGELRELLDEAIRVEDLVIPDLVEGVVYPTRALLVCGYLSAFFLSERGTGQEEEVAEPLKRLLLRELPYVKVIGEAAGPYILAIGTALDIMQEHEKGRRLVASYAVGLARANQDGSDDALPDPYHSFEDCLKRQFEADVELPDEQFAGNAYTLHVAIDWLSRRSERAVVEDIWPLATRLTLCEFRPSQSSQYLAPIDVEGILHHWQANTPESWARLREVAGRVAESEIAGELWRHPEFLHYFCLLLPYRLTAASAKALDYSAQDRAAQALVTVSLDVSEPGETSGLGD